MIEYFYFVDKEMSYCKKEKIVSMCE